MKTLIKNILRPAYHKYCSGMNYLYVHSECKKMQKFISSHSKKRVYYLGITNHSNMGDMAQHFCIKKWIKANYPDADLLMFQANVVISTEFLQLLKRFIRKEDVIVFQSGYTTQDLGGIHELMHRLVIQAVPQAKILMMPQTIFFKNPENKKRTSKIYDTASNMLFLARDEVSYNMALEMFPSIRVKLFPDIVTSLIGKYNFSGKREGILICNRNDSEKFYSDEELHQLQTRLESLDRVSFADTTIDVPYQRIRKNLQYYLENELKKIAQYKVVITDRYHGTIFSLIANTPVIVIKTNDHKVVTGVDWFKGVYDNNVWKVESLDEAFALCEKVINSESIPPVYDYFDVEYYSKLKSLFELGNR